MPANRITQLLRSVADYRVEACFLAALAFTLGHQSFHDARPAEVRTTRTREVIVHEVTPVRVAAARRNIDIVERSGTIGVAPEAPRYRVVSVAPSKPLVAGRAPTAATACPSVPLSAGAAGSGGGTCTFVRVAPRADAPVLARRPAHGG